MSQMALNQVTKNGARKNSCGAATLIFSSSFAGISNSKLADWLRAKHFDTPKVLFANCAAPTSETAIATTKIIPASIFTTLDGCRSSSSTTGLWLFTAAAMDYFSVEPITGYYESVRKYSPHRRFDAADQVRQSSNQSQDFHVYRANQKQMWRRCLVNYYASHVLTFLAATVWSCCSSY